MINIRGEYKKYIKTLISKGVCPSILLVGDIIKLLTEDEDDVKYNFNTDNIESGPMGEIIRVNIKNGTVEIYNSIMENYFSLRVYNINTGKIFEDGELYSEYSTFYSKNLLGDEIFAYVENHMANDYMDCNRIMSIDKENINIKMLELTNRLSHAKLLDLKERLLNAAKKYCKDDVVISAGVGKIVENIDSAYYMHSQFKKFESEELDEETTEIINRNIYLQNLKEESEAYSRISIFPITEIIEEYKAYNAKKTDKLAKKYTYISRKINEVLSPFCEYRVDVRNHLLTTKDIDEMNENHLKLLIKRSNELENKDDWNIGE